MNLEIIWSENLIEYSLSINILIINIKICSNLRDKLQQFLHSLVSPAWERSNKIIPQNMKVLVKITIKNSINKLRKLIF